jgi:hypothetical protein
MENSPSAESATTTHNHRGSCHCGAVRFEAIVNVFEGASKCNCSICLKVSGIGAVTKPEAFTLLEGEGSLSEYAWGGKTATRYFCKHCGIHCFGRGHLAELGGDYVSLNVNTLDDVDPSTLPLVYWDGRHNNWHAGPRSEPWPVFATASAKR